MRSSSATNACHDPTVGMYRGDFRRKATLAEYGNGCPPLDNGPLRFEEWDDAADRSMSRRRPAPGKWSAREAFFVEQVILRQTSIRQWKSVRAGSSGRPSWRVCEVAAKATAPRHRADKRMAEDLTEYLPSMAYACATHPTSTPSADRDHPRLARRFRRARRINLLREGSIFQSAAVAILDADKGRILRSETSLVQTIGARPAASWQGDLCRPRRGRSRGR